MTFWTDDIDEWFEDFAITVTLLNTSTSAGTGSSGANDTDISAIFDETQQEYDLQIGEIINSGPVLHCKSSDVANVSRRDQVRVSGVDYYINEIVNDGAGITVLHISEN